MTLLFAIVVFVVAYVWLATEKTPRHIVVLCMSLVLLIGRVITVREAMAYVKWDTLLCLLGLFALVKVLSRFGFFTWLAGVLVRSGGHRPALMFIMLPLLAGGLSMGVNNMTVMVFMTPLTLQICRTLTLDPLLFLIGEVCCANMMGGMTLIGAPPNLMMATVLNYSFIRVLKHMSPFMLAGTAIFMAFHSRRYRSMDRLGVENQTVKPAGNDSDWKTDIQTLVFFMGLFVLVGGLEHAGAFQMVANSFVSIRHPIFLLLAVLWFSAAASAVVDNVPMAIAMAYVIKSMPGTSSSIPPDAVAWASLVGLTLGGNLTPIGASPNVIAYGLLENQGIRIGWGRWFRLTAPGTLTALFGASILLWLQYGTN